MPNHKMIQAITNAIGAHGAWKMRLRTAISTGRSDIQPDHARCDDRCEFGQWIHGPSIDSVTRAGKPYEVVTRLHRDFHHTAGNVLDHALRQEKSQAEALMHGEFTERSDKLVRALTKWKGELTGY